MTEPERDADLDALRQPSNQKIALRNQSSAGAVLRIEWQRDEAIRLAKEARDERDDAQVSCDIFLSEEQAAKARTEAAAENAALRARVEALERAGQEVVDCWHDEWFSQMKFGEALIVLHDLINGLGGTAEKESAG